MSTCWLTACKKGLSQYVVLHGFPAGPLRRGGGAASGPIVHQGAWAQAPLFLHISILFLTVKRNLGPGPRFLFVTWYTMCITAYAAVKGQKGDTSAGSRRPWFLAVHMINRSMLGCLGLLGVQLLSQFLYWNQNNTPFYWKNDVLYHLSLQILQPLISITSSSTFVCVSVDDLKLRFMDIVSGEYESSICVRTGHCCLNSWANCLTLECLRFFWNSFRPSEDGEIPVWLKFSWRHISPSLYKL